MTIMNPSPALLVKLGSIIVHFDEFNSPGGHEYDLHTAHQLMADPDVKEWMDEMNGAAMLPVKRNPRS
jgi:hypothetical protein